ncbi:Serpentine Receptor, class I [Caenorhabditis elegans]|uniref:Serpentine Receptor, class I n=1 Tax=Caenorhabditis elegans TaxID=6239 RepID=O45759_CAEEL|nr:Serpentine Receptor, class I [Caenorhabditis elegans]CAB03314.2 Serpentine Receptor, class I [Caenorhabditis elegans]|eukprot:NP_506828.2 Serpentine Receptor, class I [Caenorhabditis elegans]
MPAPCPATIPDGYLLTLDIIGGGSLSMNFLAMYMIWFQSPGMHGYKYCLTYMQFASFLVEFNLTVLVPAYYFFPLTGGIAVGEVVRKYISNHMGLTIWMFMFCFVLPASLSCFIYRHTAASQIQNNASKFHLKKLVMILTHIFPFLTALGTWNCQMTFDQKYEYVRKNYPQCLFWLEFDRFEAYDYQVNPWIVRTACAAIGFLMISTCYGIWLGVHTMVILQRLRGHMSVQTYQMHLTALISLGLQMATPTVFILPVYMFVAVIVTDAVDMQRIVSWAPCLMSTHSMLLVTVMIMSNASYRKVLKDKIWNVLGLTRLTGSHIGSEVEPSIRTSNNLIGSRPVS